MADITIDTNTNFQVFRNWQATAQAAQEYLSPAATVQYPSTTFALYKTALLNAMLDLGLNSLRVEIVLSDENNTGYDPNITSLAVNDNADPNNLNPAGIHFERMLRAMNDIGIPFRNMLAAVGEPLDITLCVVDFRAGGFQAENTPAEYAEFVYAFVDKFYTTYGFLPDSIEAILEPDTVENSNWTAVKLANNMIAAASRLAAGGYNGIRWIIPSNTAYANVVTWYDAVVAQDSQTAALVDEISYHRYLPLDDAALAILKNNIQSRGKTPAMLEWIGADYNTLYSDLVIGHNTSWQQYTITFPYTGVSDDGSQYFEVDTSTWAVTPWSRTKLLRQFMKFIRRDAIRKGVTNSDANFLGVPFANSNGTLVVPIKCATGGTINVIGLPAGEYGIKFSTASLYDSDLPDQIITAGQNVSFSMPAAGVATVYDVNYLNYAAPVVLKSGSTFFAAS